MGHAPQSFERRLRPDACRIVAGDDHHLSGGISADAERFSEGWHRSLGDRVEHDIVRRDLGREREPACGQRTKRVLRRCRRVRDSTAREEPGAAIDQLPVGQRLKRLSEFSGSVDDQGSST